MCFIFTACSIFLLYLDVVIHAFEKIIELVIWDWYFSARMETISMKVKGNERKGCRYVTLFLAFVCLPIYCVYTKFLSNTFWGALPDDCITMLPDG